MTRYLIALILCSFLVLAIEQTIKEDPAAAFQSSDAWQALEKDPNLMRDSAILDLAFRTDPIKAANILNRQPGLLDTPGVSARFDMEAGNNVYILNDNPKAKVKWFSKKGITDLGAEIESYDGKIVKTKGPEATTFNINDYPNAKVLTSGRLVLANGAEITGIIAKTGNHYDVSGNADLTNANDIDISAAGIITVGDKNYQSAEGKVELSVHNKDAQLSGINVIESQDGQILSRFSGAITFHADGHKTLHSNTQYTIFSNGKESRTYKVTQDTLLYNKENKCGSTKNCIEDYADKNDEVLLLDERLKAESQKPGFNLDEFLRKEMDQFKIANFEPNPDSPYYPLYMEMINLKTEATPEVKKYINAREDHLQRMDDQQRMLVEDFYAKLEERSNQPNFNLNDFVSSEITNFKLGQFEDESKAYLHMVQLEEDSKSGEFNLNDYLSQVPTERAVKISTASKNEIDLDVHDSIVSQLKVSPIQDDSIVRYREDEGGLVFSKNSIDAFGSPYFMLDTYIYASYMDEEMETHAVTIIDGNIVHCSQCRPCGKYHTYADNVIAQGSQITEEERMWRAEMIEEEWGQEVVDYTIYLDKKNERDFVSMLAHGAETSSKNIYGVSVSPEEVAATCLMEGLEKLFYIGNQKYSEYKGRYYYTNHNPPVYGYPDLGLYDISKKDGKGEVEYNRLQRLDFIPDDVRMTKQAEIYKDGRIIYPGSFNNMYDGIAATSGVYAEKKYLSIQAYKKNEDQMSKTYDDLTETEKYYWATVFYIAGDAELKLLEQKGVPVRIEPGKKYPKWQELAAKRTAAFENIAEADLFP